jgi:hypothetical protein
MAKGVKIKKYARRTSSRRGGSRAWLAVLAVAAFVALCLAISVALGISLGNRADEKTDMGGYELPKIEYVSGGKSVKGVAASLVNVDDDRINMAEGDDVSVTLRYSDGTLSYFSPMANEVGFDSCGNKSLESFADGIHSFDGYLCGVFYVTSFGIENAKLREIYKSYEIALISEAAECGVDDILIVGIDVNDKNVVEVEEYLSRAAIAADAVPVGICLERASFPSSNSEQYVALRLRRACDYFALDTKSMIIDGYENADEIARAIVDDMYYYIEAHGLRLVVSAEDREVYEKAIELGINNLQMIAD